MNEEEELYVLTPWGCLLAVLSEYGIDCTHITGTIGNHLVDDFIEAMVTAGHVSKKESEE